MKVVKFARASVETCIMFSLPPNHLTKEYCFFERCLIAVLLKMNTLLELGFNTFRCSD
jgi:hypothetical protein